MSLRTSAAASALLVVALLVVALTAATWRSLVIATAVSLAVSILVVKWHR